MTSFSLEVGMLVDPNGMISITEANQNVSIVTGLVNEGAVANDENLLGISKRLLAQNKEVYEELAK